MVVETPQFKCLTDRQVSILKENWSQLSENSDDSGHAIFYTFLTRHPEHQKRYPAFRSISLEDLKESPQIYTHVRKIMNFFDTAINALGSDDSKSVIFNACADNADYHGKKGIQKEHFNQLRDVIIEVVTGACELDDEGQEAWNDLMDVVHHVTFNVLDELKK